MARRRMIDPNFWQSEDVSKLTIRQRLLLIGLFSNADDEGKLRGNPAFVRSLVFPYEDFTLREIEQDLADTESIGSIHQYTVEGSKYIRLINWFKFQRVDKPQSSVIPDPVQNDSENDSKNDSNPDSCLKEKKGKEVKGEEKRKEVKREEEVEEDESNGKVHSPFNHTLKDRIYKYSLKCEIQGFNIMTAEDLFYFFEKVEIEVIEHALKKSFKKHLNFAIKIINDWIGEGKTTIDQVNPKKQVGESNDKSEGFAQGVRSGENKGKGISYEGQSTVTKSRWDDTVVIPMPGMPGRGRETG